MKRIGILTGGGDAPGLNAVIRAAVKTAINEYQCEVIGIRDGYDGFLDTQNGIVPLGMEEVRGILPRGGTILGAANRGNPYARKVIRDGKEVTIDVSDEIVKGIKELGLDALLVLGGDGTLHIAHELAQKGVPVIGVPKTIDNDIGGTEITFGFDTALNIATEALDRLHTTAESHHRVMVVELMGRDAGFITLNAGISGGADVILIPEIPFKFENIMKKIQSRSGQGRKFSLIAVSEGAKPIGGMQVYSRKGDEVYVPRLGGIGQVVAEFIE
ncbi:MAG TPA: ATP-dependent 6-phosphofructokinase, partial [Anaerolineales bacterium]|nr:ATP-dependent 6-phosphofructokinase [Anaerolineales bacterium]